MKVDLPQWCEPPCILPFNHAGDCWDGTVEGCGFVAPCPCPDVCGLVGEAQ